MTKMADHAPQHFHWEMRGTTALITLDRPERKNPLTFESYAELRDTFRALSYADDVEAVVFGSNGGNFCSGGDVHDIIGPLLDKDMKGLLEFTRMTDTSFPSLIQSKQGFPGNLPPGREYDPALRVPVAKMFHDHL